MSIKAISIAAKFDPHTGFPYHCFVQTNKTDANLESNKVSKKSLTLRKTSNKNAKK